LAIDAPYGGPNRLLGSLTDADFALLAPSLSHVSLTLRHPLEVADQIPQDVFFPEGSVASVVATLGSQENFEVGLIGWEGMTGTSVLTGAPSPFDCYVQFIGVALALPTKVLVTALNTSPTLRAALGLYAHMLSVQTAYTALASAHAPIPERLARWLLMIHDRVDGSTFKVTHELLAIMLGVQRPGVTTALHVLEAEGLIKSTRGQVEVLNRTHLRARAGSAYGKTERSYEELIAAIDPNLVTWAGRHGTAP
jgi:Crp-like helix-turn-helix protein